ncbi:hypothetical protein HAZT_HAZT002992 [Hyalella azteca]|uniref:Small acidic protein-like domain-containing protein n=1 Tax=Hyalella azteca TaxID=294128 RepID=A0A6A0GNF5_HYAAZ|nr:hypothetical protein HAZT_HAZT002992 [Hyalella azteca]
MSASYIYIVHQESGGEEDGSPCTHSSAAANGDSAQRRARVRDSRDTSQSGGRCPDSDQGYKPLLLRPEMQEDTQAGSLMGQKSLCKEDTLSHTAKEDDKQYSRSGCWVWHLASFPTKVPVMGLLRAAVVDAQTKNGDLDRLEIDTTNLTDLALPDIGVDHDHEIKIPRLARKDLGLKRKDLNLESDVQDPKTGDPGHDHETDETEGEGVAAETDAATTKKVQHLFFFRMSDTASNAGLLPLPAAATGAALHLTTLPTPALPAYYNPGSISAAKYAEQERKKKLLWGNKSAATVAEGSTGLAGAAPGTAAGRGLLVNNHAALLNLARANPGGRQLNLGLGKDQFNVGSSKPTPLNAASAAVAAACSAEATAGTRGGGGGMSDLWSSTTFNNDSDGKMAEKFKRLMGVKDTAATSNKSGGSSAGSKLNEVQEDMFSNMERQYEVARLATHTHKGYGLGFTSTAYVPK